MGINKKNYEVLGGETVRGIAQNKIFIFYPYDEADKNIPLEKKSKRILEVDMNRQYQFQIDNFGEMIPL